MPDDSLTILPEATVREGLALSENVTPLPWSTPHLSCPNLECDCRYVLSEAGAGSVATVDVSNGRCIGDGGNDSPPLEEAIANGAFLVHAANHYVALANEVLARRKAMEDAPCSPGCLFGKGEVCNTCGVPRDIHLAWRCLFGYQYVPAPHSPDCWKAKWSAEREGE